MSLRKSPGAYRTNFAPDVTNPAHLDKAAEPGGRLPLAGRSMLVEDGGERGDAREGRRRRKNTVVETLGKESLAGTPPPPPHTHTYIHNKSIIAFPYNKSFTV